MNKDMLQQIWHQHGGKILGVVIGLVVGLMIIVLGFWRGLFLMVCMGIGLMIGKRIDDKEDIFELLDKILPPGYHK